MVLISISIIKQRIVLSTTLNQSTLGVIDNRGYGVKLVKFRVKHYKSIDDSGDCYFSDKLTILAGKNESGKTSILEALEDFHESKTIRESAEQISGSEKPEVMVTFDLSVDDLNEIYQEIEVDIVATKGVQITLQKSEVLVAIRYQSRAARVLP